MLIIFGCIHFHVLQLHTLQFGARLTASGALRSASTARSRQRGICGWMLGSYLDSISLEKHKGQHPTFRRAIRYLIVDIKDAFLDFLVDLFRCVDEGLFDVGRSLGRRLHEDKSVFACERLALLLFHLPSALQVTEKSRNWLEWVTGLFKCLQSTPFVPDKHDDHVRVGVLASVVQPCSQMVKSLPSGDVVH